MRHRRQRGQAIIPALLLMPVLVGALGLAIDTGMLRQDRQQLQTVADSAAIGGAAEIPYADVLSGAANAAAQNHFVDGAGGGHLTVNNPPQSGPHAGDNQYVEVIASQDAPTYFMKIFDIDSVTVTARAVAYLGSGPGCMYELNPSASGAILVNGSFNVNISCGIYVDSSSSQALLANGSGTLHAASIGIVGDYLANGSVGLNPLPTTGMVPVSDPLAYLNEPSTSGSCSTPTVINGSGNFTLNPGVYCSTLIVNGRPHVSLSPGTYVLDNGIIMNGSPTLTGSGVTLFNKSGSMTLNGSSTSTLSAPASGDYAGILVFQSRNDSSQLTINGNNSTALNGAIYAPKAKVVDNGSGAANAYSIIVADTITINGSDSLNDDYSSLPAGSPIKAAVLVE